MFTENGLKAHVYWYYIILYYYKLLMSRRHETRRRCTTVCLAMVEGKRIYVHKEHFFLGEIHFRTSFQSAPVQFGAVFRQKKQPLEAMTQHLTACVLNTHTTNNHSQLHSDQKQARSHATQSTLMLLCANSTPADVYHCQKPILTVTYSACVGFLSF
jgi:ferredoxin-like protein FixX